MSYSALYSSNDDIITSQLVLVYRQETKSVSTTFMCTSETAKTWTRKCTCCNTSQLTHKFPDNTVWQGLTRLSVCGLETVKCDMHVTYSSSLFLQRHQNIYGFIQLSILHNNNINVTGRDVISFLFRNWLSFWKIDFSIIKFVGR